jgi:hypothetical protein
VSLPRVQCFSYVSLPRPTRRRGGLEAPSSRYISSNGRCYLPSCRGPLGLPGAPGEGAPHGKAHVPGRVSPQHEKTHCCGDGQSASVLQEPASEQPRGLVQRQFPVPLTFGKQTQTPRSSLPHKVAGHAEHPGEQTADAADALALMLMRTGADHAIAAPAPMRLSADLREIPLGC